ncbi:YHS domain-containing protein [Desulfovibrio mangrovi]|uniref:TRASH domain-containing protein n=1 Tax=Desulfovibrio mangrovi TaxID=2976983 RepID=UPI0022463047|nr:TRASH domain-containing protein [Desulfovibrio mangrovi]UZP66198.1 YHS domain-containing protein [Desulfovibrio mangrovi]
MNTFFKSLVLVAMLAIGSGLVVGNAFAAEPQTKCPVMGYGINKKLYADHNGKRVYFCCPSCEGEFKKDPEKYIKKLEEQGVEVEKTPAQ